MPSYILDSYKDDINNLVWVGIITLLLALAVFGSIWLKNPFLGGRYYDAGKGRKEDKLFPISCLLILCCVFFYSAISKKTFIGGIKNHPGKGWGSVSSKEYKSSGRGRHYWKIVYEYRVADRTYEGETVYAQNGEKENAAVNRQYRVLFNKNCPQDAIIDLHEPNVISSDNALE